ncbi:MAG: tRNA (adenosine(37)-N6)-threonylcarbamoyltransferase complex dimerization subunit type 1 TsaB [Elusimicrobiota bacterium]|nr:tRNA (adenosine(37)-N6)-threonylcarbamoyltransferase complex dimerization subunit type 1 TsaB [Endomicrobiia bacterium]MDW8055895.1 tRNA (adenosine(37)-N6)-threonylcarbamoyltransferase complex dimerization subunit type 1 TsaB [Elusimicrobiota bacterium]
MTYDKILTLDTSTSKLSVTVYSNNRFYLFEQNSMDHSEKLTIALDTLLHEAKIKVKDLDIIGVNTGPGSFTGLRIGLCFIRELLNFCKMKYVVTTSSFMMLLYEFKRDYLESTKYSYNEIVTLFPSVKNEFYLCKFILRKNRIKKIGKENYVRKDVLEKAVSNQAKHKTYYIAPDIVELQGLDKIKRVRFSSAAIAKMIIEQNREFYRLTSVHKLIPFYLRHTYY